MRILMIEDDIDLCCTVSFLLENEGYTVDLCHNGKNGLDTAKTVSYDIIILDRMLPILDGLTVLKALREEKIQTPVLLLTALGTLDDKVIGLDAGADDYLTKPFEIKELLARIRVLLRRATPINADITLFFEYHTLNPIEKTLTYKEKNYALTSREASLFEYFFKHPNIALHREGIITSIWGAYPSIEDGNLDNYIYFLRKILKSLKSPLYIKTIRAVGFKLEKEVPDVQKNSH